MKLRALALWVLGMLVVESLLLLPTPARPQELAPARVVVVLAEGLTFSDLIAYGGREVRELMDRAALGLMSLSGAHRYPVQAALLLGGGKPARVPDLGVLALNVSEEYEGEAAGRVYERRTGLTAPPAGVVVPEWPSLTYLTDARLGLAGRLAEEVHRAGLKTATFGNSDSTEERSRPAALVVSDRWGRVDYGDVGSRTLILREEGLLRWETDLEYVLREIRRLPAEVAVVAVDFGDGHRVGAYHKRAFAPVMDREKERLIARLVSFLTRLEEQSPLPTRVLLVGLTPGAEAVSDHRLLVPVLMLGAGVRPGWLSSPTTRRPGLVAALDFAPTVLQYLGLPVPPDLPGRPWEVTESPRGVEGLAALEQRFAFVHRLRSPIIRAYLALVMVAMGLAVLAFVGPLGIRPRVRRALPGLLLFLGAVPLAFLLLAPLPPVSPFVYAGMAILGAGTIALACLRLGSDYLRSWVLLAAALVLALAVDTLAGAPWQGKALLGYDPASGARYYGIGNEYMGVLVGSALLAGGGLLETGPKRWRKAAAALIWAVVLMLLAAPGYGANAGGTVTAGCGFGAAGLLLVRGRLNGRAVLGVGAGTGALLVAAALWDASRSTAVQSHFGRALELVVQEGWPAVAEIVQRKLSTNLRLLRYTIWTRALLAGMAVLAVLSWQPVGRLEEIRHRLPRLGSCLGAMVIASFVALVFNDSGIVAAATMMIYGIGPLLSLVLDDKTLLTKAPPGGKMGVD
ncbi:MAG: hypothetical protein ACPLRW_05205 [Moorellales bacterium]